VGERAAATSLVGVERACATEEANPGKFAVRAARVGAPQTPEGAPLEARALARCGRVCIIRAELKGAMYVSRLNEP